MGKQVKHVLISVHTGETVTFTIIDSTSVRINNNRKLLSTEWAREYWKALIRKGYQHLQH